MRTLWTGLSEDFLGRDQENSGYGIRGIGSRRACVSDLGEEWLSPWLSPWLPTVAAPMAASVAVPVVVPMAAPVAVPVAVPMAVPVVVPMASPVVVLWLHHVMNEPGGLGR